MKTKMWPAVCATALLMFTALAPLTASHAATTAAETSDRRVYAGVYLHDVASFDLKNGVFEADVEMWAKWRGDFDPKQLRVANAASAERVFLGAEEDGNWHSARWRIRGTLRGEFPVEAFPFDEQILAVVLELPERYGHLIPDAASSGMATSFSITDWLYDPVFRPASSDKIFRSDLGNLDNEGSATTVHRVAFKVMMRRPVLMVVLKLFLPLAIIALVALASLYLHPKEVEARAGMGVTALLSCFAFQFTVSDSLPAVAYVTMADLLFLVAYSLSAISIAETIITAALARTGKESVAKWIDRLFRILIPLGSAAVVWVILPNAPRPATNRLTPLPVMTRITSAREVLRIGTSLLPSVSAAPVTAGAAWSLLHETAEGEKHPVFVERAPGVENDAMRLLAGGQLEITWRLREEAKWSDGEPLTSEDLAFPIKVSPDERMVAVAVSGERSFIVRWEDRLAGALESPSVLPAHALEKVLEDGDYDALRAYMRENPIPTLGPYAVLEFVKNDHLIAELNEHFIGPPPAIKRVEVRYFSDREELIREFEAGNIDITAPNSVTLEQATELAKRRPDAVHIRPSALHVFLNPDLAVPLLGKLKTRRAILQAIDRKRIAREVYDEAGRVSHIPIPGELPPDVAMTGHDPEAAAKALEEAGAKGEKISLIRGASPTDERIANLVAADLEAVGLTIEVLEVKSSFAAYRARGHGGLLLHVVRGTRDADPRRYWNLPLEKGRYPLSARNDAYTEEVHLLVERELRALYPERREQLRDALFAAYSERLPNIPLVFAAERIIAHPDLRNWDKGPSVRFGLGIENWYFVLTTGGESRPAGDDSKDAGDAKDDKDSGDEKDDKDSGDEKDAGGEKTGDEGEKKKKRKKKKKKKKKDLEL